MQLECQFELYFGELVMFVYFHSFIRVFYVKITCKV